MARPWPAPQTGDTLHVIGDVHIGRTDGGQPSAQNRANRILADLTNSVMLPSVAAHVQVGDFVEDGKQSAQDTLANAWANSLPQAVYGVIGNHDMVNYVGDDSQRTPDEAVTAYTSWTNRTANWSQDIGFCKLIGLKPEPIGSVGGGDMATVTATHTTFLNTELGNTSLPCVVIFHCPLASSVLGDTADEYTSVAATDPNFAWNGTAAVKATLNAHSTAKVVLSGHTHSSIDGSVPQIVTTYSVGTRNVIAINASAVIYQGKGANAKFGPVKTFYLTFTAGGSLEVRIRNNGAGVWDGIGATKLTTITVPA